MQLHVVSEGEKEKEKRFFCGMICNQGVGHTLSGRPSARKPASVKAP